MSSDTQNITPSPVDIIVPNARNFSDQVQNLTQDYTTNSSLFNHAIRCNEVARYFYTERRGKSFVCPICCQIFVKGCEFQRALLKIRGSFYVRLEKIGGSITFSNNG